MSAKHNSRDLEEHYRPCACRSTTPFFCLRKNENGELSHPGGQEGHYHRTLFQHDRDKVLYSRSFRKLRLKTQIFPEHASDYLRTRLDHTLEVAQIARHFARRLRLNEDLVDAIALAHDLGHTPFAHSGERALHKFLTIPENNAVDKGKGKRRGKVYDGFRHNWQGLRVIDKLDSPYPEHPGLNLTNAVRIGVLRHTSEYYQTDERPDSVRCFCDMRESGEDFWSAKRFAFEIQLVALADDIAAAIHDFEDAITSKTLTLKEVVLGQHSEWKLVKRCRESIQQKAKLPEWKNLENFNFGVSSKVSCLQSRLRSEIIYQLTDSVIKSLDPKLNDWEDRYLQAKEDKERIELYNRFIKDGGEFPNLMQDWDLFQDFKMHKDQLTQWVVNSERVKRMDGKADYTIRKILEVYCTDPMQVPDAVLENFASDVKCDEQPTSLRRKKDSELKNLGIPDSNAFMRAIVDYVAGMTDRFALREFDRLYSAYPRIDL